MKRRILSLVGLAVVVTPLAVTAPASADHGRPFHWGRNFPTATAVSQVYFEDFTGSNWPVTSIVPEWDRRPGYVRAFYRSANGCNNDAIHCVPVRAINDPNEFRGLTTFRVDFSSNHIIHNSVRVQLNNAYNYTVPLRREVTCHELGHATAFYNEGNQDSSCMAAGAPYVDNPNSHDYNIIENIYDH